MNGYLITLFRFDRLGSDRDTQQFLCGDEEGKQGLFTEHIEHRQESVESRAIIQVIAQSEWHIELLGFVDV